MAEPLKRRIGLGLLTAYGVGVMVGAGIYVLVGAVVADAGIWAPLSFVLAGLIAAPTALSYAEFSSRVPEAAGEAAFVGQGFGSQSLALLVGLAVVVAGTVSAGAVLRGGAGYLTAATGVDGTLAIIAMGLALVAVAVIGVLESLSLAAVFTAIELTGLALVIWAGGTGDVSPDWALPQDLPGITVWAGLGLGAVLAFFAFIGFEDIVNMAEEVSEPTRTMPKAILLSLTITSIIYALVCWAAVRTVPVADLSQSSSPLALVWQTARGSNPDFLSYIAVFAALNGILAQIVMASRVLFGLGKRSPALALFHHAHPRFGTPVLATLVLGAAVILTALFFSVDRLAEVTSSVLLSVFVLVNLALILQKRHAPGAPFQVPMTVPIVGLVLSAIALTAAVGGML
ncbi:amino acid permease [Phaeobacter gallaeciensis]|uniref:APC family permease n=1 Tax=Phaeobacter gallaeciensis TaxID=60890 RepID=UPI0023805B07|nr:amino acid permease [Phaeobacter gallaeciensis]MDE4275457.1 amino acid permease [Phaeobacter gallaeciensis]MDE4300792.1 amino acid permease [Phaeobacter gallaeciensis]MDE5185956.1 amino acid permease [Phaeobacter gallaeciensis]